MPETSRMLFVNLAVEDLQRSIDFFTRLGFTFDPRFTDDSATCMNISEMTFAMLMVKPRFKGFTAKEICDLRTHTEVLLALSCDSREEVDRLADTAIANGGSVANPPADHGFMYNRSFQDPDGHTWEVAWMDVAAMEAMQQS